MTCFVVIFALLPWSGAEPARSWWYVCSDSGAWSLRRCLSERTHGQAQTSSPMWSGWGHGAAPQLEATQGESREGLLELGISKLELER